MRADKNIEAYHIDKHHNQDCTLIKNRLKHVTQEEMNNLPIICFVSPQSLESPTSPWMPILNGLVDKEYVSMLCIEEAHTIEQHGRLFCPDLLLQPRNYK